MAARNDPQVAGRVQTVTLNVIQKDNASLNVQSVQISKMSSNTFFIMAVIFSTLKHYITMKI